MYLFIFILFQLANSEDPDQMLSSAASDLGLHCLPMSQKWDARLISVTALIFPVLRNCIPVLSFVIGWCLMCLWSGPLGFNCWICFAPEFNAGHSVEYDDES